MSGEPNEVVFSLPDTSIYIHNQFKAILFTDQPN